MKFKHQMKIEDQIRNEVQDQLKHQIENQTKSKKISDIR